MYAIVEIAGQQFKVAKDQQIFVHRLDEKEGSNVTFDNVLLIDNDGKVNVGAPVIKGASVSGKVLEHVKSDKVTVFKKKRRKGYKKKQGHRQLMTSVQISSISEKGGTAKKASAAKSETKDPKSETKDIKTEKKAAPKKTTAKKSETTTKKSTTKKAESKPKTQKSAAEKPASGEKKTSAKKSAPKKESAAKKEDK